MVCTTTRHESNASCLEELESVRVKGLKRRGLSRFYSDRSQSFASLDLVLSTPHGESVLGLAKRSTSSTCEERVLSQSLPVSPEHTLLSGGDCCSLRHNPAPLSYCQQYHLPHHYHHMGLSKSDGGAYDFGSSEGSTHQLSGTSWQQQAADDICSALHMRCSLGYTSSSVLSEDDATQHLHGVGSDALTATFRIPCLHRGSLESDGFGGSQIVTAEADEVQLLCAR